MIDNEDMIELVKDYLKDNLELECVSKETYRGGTGDGSMYRTYHEITLRLGGEVISEVTLD